MCLPHFITLITPTSSLIYSLIELRLMHISLSYRFDIDISTPIFVDTLRAEKFISALTKRQEELGMAKENVKIMAEIGLKLRDNRQSVSECVESLKKLEEMFRIDHRNDDNVQDFYDMGRYIVSYIVTL